MTKTAPQTPRALDHCVLPVESLEIARARYQALGFVVAADARHPFGTENACVFFKDGTYFEPLAIGQREDCERTAEKGNVFTARDQTYRFRQGETGFSALALHTQDADRDHKFFSEKAMSAGKKLMFGRAFVDGDGKKSRATFKLSFAADLRAPDSFLFTCQRINVPPADRSKLVAHENGVTGTLEIIASEQNPSDFQYYLQDVCDNRETEAHSFGMELKLANANINVMTPESLKAYFGIEREIAGRGLVFEGVVLKVENFAKLQAAVEKSGVSLRKAGKYLIADRAPGQGAFLAFAEE